MRSSWGIAAGALLALALGSTLSRAQDNPWEVRLRTVYFDPANQSDAFALLGIPQNAIHINGRWLPDLDIEYRFSPYWSSELLLTYPQSETVTIEHSILGGPTRIGTFHQLPPTLLLQYNFSPEDRFQPYVGVGVNVTILSDVHLSAPGVGPLQLDRTSVGPAAQAGFDFRLTGNWYFNADIKWAMIRSDVTYGGAKVSKLRIDPLLFGAGVGYRFGGQ